MSLLLSTLALVVCAFFSGVSLAQEDVFLTDLLANLDNIGLTNFTSIVRQVQGDSTQPTFFQALTNSSQPQTLFVPNNDAFLQPAANFFGYSYQASSTDFLASLLLYHLLPGTYLPEDLGTGSNHTVVPTTLQGRNCVFLENNEPQVIAMGANANGIEVYNQATSTTVSQTYTYQQLTIHVINAIIGFPGSPTFGVNSLGLTEFSALVNVSGVQDLDDQQGMTIFAPIDDAFNPAVKSQVAYATASGVFSNHIIFGHTIWYPDFQSKQYTAASGFNYTLTPTSSMGYTVTLNGITANIVRSDFLTNNGVIHLIDQVLWNTTQETASVPGAAVTTSGSPLGSSDNSTLNPTGSGSSSPPVSSSGSPDSNSANDASGAPQSKSSTLSAGTIIGIVAVVGLAVVVPIGAFIIWRYRRQAHTGGTKVLNGFAASAPNWDLPSPARRITPFTLHSTTGSADSMTNLMPDVFMRSNTTESSITMSPIAQTRPRHFQEKAPYSGLAYDPISPNSDASSQVPQSSFISSGRPQHVASPIAMSAEVVENLWQEFAQRIDRGPPPRKSGVTIAPPKYPSPERRSE